MTTNQAPLETAQQLKWKEIQVHQVKLGKLQADLEMMNTKITAHEKLSEDDIHYLGDLGWLAALSVSIAALALAV